MGIFSFCRRLDSGSAKHPDGCFAKRQLAASSVATLSQRGAAHRFIEVLQKNEKTASDFIDFCIVILYNQINTL